MLDAILERDWESRYYSFDPRWAPNEMLGSMRNGEGDWFFAWLPEGGGAAIRGFDHESAMTPFRRRDHAPWPGLYEGLPATWVEVPSMGGFPPEEVTFCLWNSGKNWQTGPVVFPSGETDPDGSERLLALLDDDPASYVRFAGEYYDRAVPLIAVQSIYRGDPLTKKTVLAIAPDADMKAVAAAAQEIGYPMTTTKKTAKKSDAKATAETGGGPARGPVAESDSAKTAAPPAPKAAATKGLADFTVEVRGPTVNMLVNGKVAAEHTGDGFALYNELFDLVKARIKGRKTQS